MLKKSQKITDCIYEIIFYYPFDMLYMLLLQKLLGTLQRAATCKASYPCTTPWYVTLNPNRFCYTANILLLGINDSREHLSSTHTIPWHPTQSNSITVHAKWLQHFAQLIQPDGRGKWVWKKQPWKARGERIEATKRQAQKWNGASQYQCGLWSSWLLSKTCLKETDTHLSTVEMFSVKR